jgi:hypothetical protein
MRTLWNGVARYSLQKQNEDIKGKLFVQKMPAVVVTGVLVNEPNVSLLQWIRFTIVCYLAYYVYVAIQYTMDDSAGAWDVAIIALCVYMFALRLPMYGIRAATTSNEKALTLFSCAQMALAVWNILQLILMWSLLAKIIQACRDCGDKEPCVIDSQYQNITLSQGDCETPLPTTNQALVTLFLSLMAFSSVVTSLHARKTKNAKVVTVVGMADVPDIPTATGSTVLTDVQVEVV